MSSRDIRAKLLSIAISQSIFRNCCIQTWKLSVGKRVARYPGKITLGKLKLNIEQLNYHNYTITF